MSALLSLVPLRGWLIIAAIVAALVAALYFRQHFINQGASNATSAIERANNAANDKATIGGDEAGNAFDACLAAHGRWDRSNLVCVHNPR